MWFLFLLAVAVAIAAFVWDYRRKAARRAAASKERFQQMFESRNAAAPAAAAAPVAPAARSASGGQAAFAPASRLLGQAETLVYYLLRTGMPDHAVFAKVTMAAVVGAPAGPDREQQLRRLAQYQLDFVLCDRSMGIAAVVEVEHAASTEMPAIRRFKADTLKAAGIPVVTISSAALPSRDEIRRLVLDRGGRTL